MADILILQEVDLNARRTHRLNMPKRSPEAADELCVRARVPGTCSGSKPLRYHGQAILAKWPISNFRLIRFFPTVAFWHLTGLCRKIEPFQERRGGRMR